MQKTVAVVTAHPHSQVLDTLLDAGGYDVVFIEGLDHAYSHIKSVMPHLVIVCLEMEDDRGFQVLSMLAMDHETMDIPVLTFVRLPDRKEPDRGAHDLVWTATRAQIAVPMN